MRKVVSSSTFVSLVSNSSKNRSEAVSEKQLSGGGEYGERGGGEYGERGGRPRPEFLWFGAPSRAGGALECQGSWKVSELEFTGVLFSYLGIGTSSRPDPSWS